MSEYLDKLTKLANQRKRQNQQEAYKKKIQDEAILSEKQRQNSTEIGSPEDS